MKLSNRKSKIAAGTFSIVAIGAYGIPHHNKASDHLPILPPKNDVYDNTNTSTFSNYRTGFPIALDIVPSIKIAYAQDADVEVVFPNNRKFILANIWTSIVSFFSGNKDESVTAPIITPANDEITTVDTSGAIKEKKEFNSPIDRAQNPIPASTSIPVPETTTDKKITTIYSPVYLPSITLEQVDKRIADALSLRPSAPIQRVEGGVSRDLLSRQMDSFSNSIGRTVTTLEARIDAKQGAFTAGDLTSGASALTVSGGTGAIIGSGVTFGLGAGYDIPLTASTTEWSGFYATPSTRITAGTGLSWSGNSLSAAAASWGSITGTLSAQTDLQSALDLKLAISGLSGCVNALSSIAVGTTNTASGANSSAVGYCNVALALNSSLFGRSNFSGIGGLAAVSVGILNNQTGGSINTGTGAITGTPAAATNIGELSIALGTCNSTCASRAIAVGYGNIASIGSSVAVGFCNGIFSGCSGVAFGSFNTSCGSVAGAFGVSNIACGCKSSAFGSSNLSSGCCSSAFGLCNTASGCTSSAFGTCMINDASASTQLGVCDGAQAGWINIASNKCLTTAQGAHLTTGGTWTNMSSRDVKENFITLDKQDILQKISALDITRWNYKAESKDASHIGPIAQDFYEKFKTGDSDTSISTIDPAGVALVGIQALSEKINVLEKEMRTSVFSTSTADGAHVDSQSSILSTISSFISSIKEFVLDKVTATVGLFKTVQTDKLCVEDICVTKDEFKALLDSKNIASAPAPAAVIIVDSAASTTIESVATTSITIQETASTTVPESVTVSDTASSSDTVAPVVIETVINEAEQPISEPTSEPI